MAGDPMHQHFMTFGATFFGGIFNQDNISPDSDLVQMVLSEEGWYEPFDSVLHSKFPYLLNRVKGINDILQV